MAMVAAALVPIAPSGLVYFVAGASHIRFRDFLLGSAIGMIPGVAVLSPLGSPIGSAEVPNPYRKGLKTKPAIKAFVYWHGTLVTSFGPALFWADTTPISFAAYKRMGADPYFGP